MTKKEIKTLQALEANAWNDLKEAEYEFVIENFPAGYGYTRAQLTGYLNKQPLRSLLDVWNAYYTALDALGVPTDMETHTNLVSEIHDYLEGRSMQVGA